MDDYWTEDHQIAFIISDDLELYTLAGQQSTLILTNMQTLSEVHLLLYIFVFVNWFYLHSHTLLLLLYIVIF